MMKTATGRLVCALLGVIVVGAALAWALRAPSVTPQMLAEGRELFVRDWTADDPSAAGDGLGPVFNARSCVACHFQGGVGGGGTNDFNVTGFLVEPSADDPTVREGVIHAFATRDEYQESHEGVRRLFPVIRGGIRVSDGCRTFVSDKDPVRLTSINTPPLFGLGLIETIAGWAIHYDGLQRSADAASRQLSGDFDNIATGAIRVLPGRRIGRFGWKGQAATLEEFVANACAMELGLSNPHRKQPVPGEFVEDVDAELDMSRQQLRALVAFVRELPRPQQVWPNDSEALQSARLGGELFVEIGCADCHTPSLGGVEGVYTDMRLHDVEKRNANGGGIYGAIIVDDAPWPAGTPRPQHWKTPPLWGVADSAPYFHDGGSPTLEAAILRHSMEARRVTERYEALSKAEQFAVIAFLKTLRAPAEARPRNSERLIARVE